MKSLFERLTEAKGKYPNQEIVLGGTFSFEELLPESVEKSVERRVLVSTKTPELATELFRCLLGGGIFVPLNSMSPKKSREYVRESVSKPSDLDIDLDQVRAIIHTSGSTGMPKGVVMTDEMVSAGIETVQEGLRYGEGDVVVNLLPWFFDAGLNQFLVGVLSGAKVVCLNHLLGPISMSNIISCGGTHLLGTPTLWWSLVSSGVVAESVKQVANTGAPLTPPLVRELKNVFPNAEIIPMYGTTEGHCRATFGSSESLPRGTVGKPLGSSKVEIINGEIVLSGSIVSPGYWRGEQTGFKDGKFFTGDLGEWTEEGELKVTGRQSEMIKIRGVRTSPGEVEAYFPGSSVAFLNDEGVLEVRTEGELPEGLPPLYRSARMRRVEELPRLGNGKIDRKKTRDLVFDVEPPCYKYDLEGLETHTREVVQRLNSVDVSVKYAVKANRSLEVLRALSRGGVQGFDTSSAGELRLGSEISMPNVSISGPSKSFEDLQASIDFGALVEVETLAELKMLASLGGDKYAIRVRPPFKVRGASVDMSKKWFGSDLESVGVLARYGEELGLNLRGFHCFPGSQNLSTEGLVEYFKNVIPFLYDLAEKYEVDSPYLNIGGGLGVPYHENQTPVNLDEIVEAIGSETKGRSADWWIELGRYLVAPFGDYVVSVTGKKYVGDEVFVLTNGGMNHHSAASGNLGAVIPRNYPVEVCVRSSLCLDEFEVVTVVGNLCTTIDTLARQVKLPKLSRGDQVVIKMSGAYGLTASPVEFLAQPRPREVFLE